MPRSVDASSGDAAQPRCLENSKPQNVMAVISSGQSLSQSEDSTTISNLEVDSEGGFTLSTSPILVLAMEDEMPREVNKAVGSW